MSDLYDPTEPYEPVSGLGATDPGRRTVKVVHLVLGLVFLGIAGIWALGTSGAVAWGDSVRYLVPIVLVAAGGVGLAVSLIAGARRRNPEGSNR